MGWATDDGRHEGWAAVVFPDGRVSCGSSGYGALVAPVGPDGKVGSINSMDPANSLDGTTAVGWRGHCECAWRGPTWSRVSAPHEEEFANRRVYDPNPELWGNTPEQVEEAIYKEWHSHLEPATITAVRDAATAVGAAQARLDEAVRAAREDGRSWALVGEAVGITRQSAHERWGSSVTAGRGQVPEETGTVYCGACGAAMQVPTRVFAPDRDLRELYFQDCEGCGQRRQING